MRVVFMSVESEVECLAFGYLGAYLKAAGHEVMLCRTNDDDTIVQLCENRPDVLCYSVTTGWHKYYRDMHYTLNTFFDRDTIGVFGGPHPTFFPEYVSSLHKGVIVRGEGYEVLVDIINSLEHDGVVDMAIPNVNNNPLRPLMDKSTLLPPDRNLMYTYPDNYNNPIKSIMASFGCVFSCPYCYNSNYRDLYKGYTQQLRPIETVANELDELRAYPLELVYFQDDIFPVFSSKWLSDFCQMYSTVRVPFHVQLRAEFITDEVISQLTKVGLHSVTFAVESGDEKFRADVLRRRQDNNIIQNAANILHKYRLRFRIENMLGAPGESLRQALTTVDLNAACQPTYGWASVFQPYPGTKLGNRAISDGLFDGNVDAISETFSSTYLLNTTNARAIINLQRLFSLAVRFRAIRWLLPLLINLPLTDLYTKFGLWFKRFCYKSKLYHVSRRTLCTT